MPRTTVARGDFADRSFATAAENDESVAMKDSDHAGLANVRRTSTSRSSSE
jgi:hypothetical protein